MHIVTVAEMRELEAQADQRYGLSSLILMNHAGKSAADLFIGQLLSHQPIQDLSVLLLIGPGNNGGDGLVMAKHLEQRGARVSLYHWKKQVLTMGGHTVPENETTALLEKEICAADYIIDALLGTGTSRPLTEQMRLLLERVMRERSRRGTLRIVAIDLPTGVNADTGEVDSGTLCADTTITLACPKQGFFFFPARDYIGTHLVGDIGLPPELEKDIRTEMLTRELVQGLLPPRPLNSNKGTFGKVMLFCGSPPYLGSAYLTGVAAARTGSGLITLAVTEKMLPVYASAFHEATFVLLPEEETESFARANTLINHLDGYRVLVMGPGLGQSANTREVILQILEHLRSLPVESRPALVVDADGLNNLSALEYWWSLLPEGAVITPHPMEMSRLCHGTKVSGGSIDRLVLARQKACEWQVNLVLKGACTIITEPAGRTRINWSGTPSLATAGTGDVLAGMVAGFLAQRLSPFDAASAAVYLHTAAANLVEHEMGIERVGLVASDLLTRLPRAIAETRAAKP
jgi:hydroxyethylthiazole kinase-like uncharacterized protein yjeF